MTTTNGLNIDLDSPRKADSTELRALWNLLDTPVYLILDGDGENAENGQLREVWGGQWLTVDDVDGFRLLDADDVRGLLGNLSPAD